MLVNILVFGTKNFNNSLDELKNKLQFNIINYGSKDCSERSNLNYHLVLIDGEFLLNSSKIDQVNFDSFKLPVLFLTNPSNKRTKNFFFHNQINLPLNVFDLRKKINDLLASHIFNLNSSVNIKNYIVDKNLKTMRKDKLTISLTEKEVDLLVLLNDKKKPLNKQFILKKVWKYSTAADTHTVETHIYRLRKKVLDNFGDLKFINIVEEGYLL